MKFLFKKAGLLSIILLFSAQAEFETQKDSFKKEVLFDKSLDINVKVQKWTNTFFAKFFKKEFSDITIRFSRYTDTSYGFIEGIFKAELNPELSQYPSFFDGTFLFYVDPNNGKSSEYGLHFETEFRVTQSSGLFDFIQNEPFFCEGEESSVLLSFCHVFEIQNQASEKKKLPVITQSLLNWKNQLIYQLSSIEDTDFLPIQDRFVNWIENRIVINESKNQKSVTVSIDLSGMREEFEEEGKSFLVNTELTDYSLETFQLEFFEDEILVYLHVRKLHVFKRVKLLMEYLSSLQTYVFEDEKKGIKLAENLRQAVSDRSLSRTELLQLGATAVTPPWMLTDTITEVEEDLGLD